MAVFADEEVGVGLVDKEAMEVAHTDEIGAVEEEVVVVVFGERLEILARVSFVVS